MQKYHKHKAHSWHSINIGKNVPEEVTAFIKIVHMDTINEIKPQLE